MATRDSQQSTPFSSIKPTDIVYNEFIDSKHHLEQLNIENTEIFQTILSNKNKENDDFCYIIGMRIPPMLTKNELTELLQQFWNSTKKNEIDPNTMDQFHRFIISKGLEVTDFQNYQLQQMLNRENQQLLSQLVSQQSQNIINEFTPKGPTLDQIPIQTLSADSFIDYHYLFDMELTRSTVLTELHEIINKQQLKPEALRLYETQIIINTKKLLLATETFQITNGVLPPDEDKSHYYTIYHAQRQTSQGPIQEHAHQVTIKTYALPALIITKSKSKAIQSQNTKQNKQLVMYNILLQSLQQMQDIKTDPRLIMVLEIEFNTNYPIKHIVSDIINITLDIRGTGVSVQGPIKMPGHLDEKYKQFKRRVKFYRANSYTKLKEKWEEAKHIESIYGQIAMNKLVQQKQTVQQRLQSQTNKEDVILFKSMNEDLEERKQKQYQQLQTLRELKRQIETIKLQRRTISSYYDKILKCYSPLITQTHTVPTHPEQQNNMIFINVLISKLGLGYTNGVQYCTPRPSIQAKSIDNLMIMDFKSGKISYKFDHHHHRKPNDMKRLINYLERHYQQQKYTKLIKHIENRIILETNDIDNFLEEEDDDDDEQEEEEEEDNDIVMTEKIDKKNNALKQSAIMEYIYNEEASFQYNITDVIMYCGGLINHPKIAIPINYPTMNSELRKLRIIKEDNQLFMIDNKSKTVFIHDKMYHDKSLSNEIKYNLNGIDGITKLEQDMKYIAKHGKQQIAKIIINENVKDELQIKQPPPLFQCVYEENKREKKLWNNYKLTTDQQRVVSINYHKNHYEGPVHETLFNDIIQCTMEMEQYQKWLINKTKTLTTMEDEQQRKQLITYSNTKFQDILIAMRNKIIPFHQTAFANRFNKENELEAETSYDEDSTELTSYDEDLNESEAETSYDEDRNE